jgi:hypothetical protein
MKVAHHQSWGRAIPIVVAVVSGTSIFCYSSTLALDVRLLLSNAGVVGCFMAPLLKRLRSKSGRNF